MNTPDENQFDDLLRDTFTGFRAQPDGYVWAGVQAAIRPHPPTFWQRFRPVGVGMLLGAFLAGVSLFLMQQTTPAGKISLVSMATPPPPPGTTTLPGTAAAPTWRSASAEPKKDVANPVERTITRPRIRQRYEGAAGSNAMNALLKPIAANPLLPNTIPMVTPPHDSLPPAAGSESVALTNAGVRSTLPWRTGLALDTALHAALTRAYLPERPGDTSTSEARPPTSLDSAAAHRVHRILLAEAVVLRKLTLRNDSLLQLVSEAPAPADTLPLRSTPPPPSRWSVLLAQEISTGWGTMPGLVPAATEKIQFGQAQSINVVRQLNNRWRIRLGAGQATVSSQLRYEFDSIGRRVHFDTAHTTTVQLLNSVDTSVIVRQTMIMRLEPILNNIGQVIGYDTSYIPSRDTSYLIVKSYDTLRTHKTEVTRREETWREQGRQLLRPEYRFWTFPLAGQYAFWTHGPWRLGVSAGAQVIIFRGGTRPVLRGGVYRLERVGPRDGPFRPVSLAWQASADAECRLGRRLSVSVSPGMRGWMIRPERGSKGSGRLIPVLQMGLMWDF